METSDLFNLNVSQKSFKCHWRRFRWYRPLRNQSWDSRFVSQLWE